MSDKATRPKFAQLQYHVLHDFKLSIAEYFLLDMVYYLSRDRWCNKSLESIAYDMRLTKNGVVKMRDRLIHRKLLLKDLKGRLRTSVLYNSVYLEEPNSYNSVTRRTTEYNAAVQLSGTKNNNRITLELSSPKKEFNKYGIETLASAQKRIAYVPKGK